MVDELREVHLRGLPLPQLAQSRDRIDALLREFDLIATAREDDHVPQRLTEFVRHARQAFSSFTRRPHLAIDAAIARGDQTIDIAFEVPEAVGQAARQLLSLLDEADRYCRSGDLLTLVASPELGRFQTWYLNQFISQLEGDQPEPWRSEPAHTPR